MNDLESHICLNLIPGIGPIKVNYLTEIFGSAGAIFKQSAKSLRSVEGIGPKLAELLVSGPRNYNPEAELRLVEQAGVRLISRSCPEYPELLKHIPDPPLVLYVKGDVSALDKPNNSIALVGSRRPSYYGLEMAASLSVSASAANWSTVSGLALGIDTAVHKATVDAAGTTIAVLGSGLGHLYPQENISLAREICDKGAVISEFPMTYPPDKRSFPMRNRIISGMSRGTLVVEAGLKSGTMITSGQALEQGRTVFAVPGRANQPHSRGCHSLIRDGAILIESFADVLEEYHNILLVDLPESRQNSGLSEKKENLPALLELTLSETEQKILEFLSEGDAAIDTIVEKLQLTVGKVLTTLLQMETKRLVKPLPGRRYALRK